MAAPAVVYIALSGLKRRAAGVCRTTEEQPEGCTPNEETLLRSLCSTRPEALSTLREGVLMLQDGEKGVVIQRDKVTYAVAPHLVCGVADPATLRRIADVAERHGLTIKVTSEQRIALIGVTAEMVDQVWQELGLSQGHMVGNTVRGVKACPGTDFCKRGQQNSLSMGKVLDERYHGMPLPGKMKFGVSGCGFQCAETNFKDIGVVGKPKGWAIYIGGNGGGKPRIGQLLVDNVDEQTAVEIVDRLVVMFRKNAQKHDRMGRLVERLGMEAIRNVIGLGADGTLSPRGEMVLGQ